MYRSNLSTNLVKCYNQDMKKLLFVIVLATLILVLSKFTYYHIEERDEFGSVKIGASTLSNIYGDKISCPVNLSIVSKCDKYPSILFFKLVLKE